MVCVADELSVDVEPEDLESTPVGVVVEVEVGFRPIENPEVWMESAGVEIESVGESFPGVGALGNVSSIEGPTGVEALTVLESEEDDLVVVVSTAGEDNTAELSVEEAADAPLWVERDGEPSTGTLVGVRTGDKVDKLEKGASVGVAVPSPPGGEEKCL